MSQLSLFICIQCLSHSQKPVIVIAHIYEEEEEEAVHSVCALAINASQLVVFEVPGGLAGLYDISHLLTDRETRAIGECPRQEG